MEGFVRAGKLRVIAVSGTKRFPSLPDAPTIAERAREELARWRRIAQEIHLEPQ